LPAGTLQRVIDDGTQCDRQAVLEAVQRDGEALRSACGDLRSDKSIVLAAVRQSGKALRFAATQFLSDTEVCTWHQPHLCEDDWFLGRAIGFMKNAR
jgi:hypothetical protein